MLTTGTKRANEGGNGQWLAETRRRTVEFWVLQGWLASQGRERMGFFFPSFSAKNWVLSEK